FNFSFDDLQMVAYDKMRFFVTASREFEGAYSSPSGKHGAFTEMLLKGLNPSLTSEGVVTSMDLKLFIEQELIQVPQKPLVSNGSREILLTSTPEKKHLFDSSNASSKTSNWICRDTLTGHGDRVTSVAISPDGKIIASGSLDRTIKLWDLATGRLVQTIKQHSGAVTCVTFSQDRQTLASSSARPDGSIKLWNVNTGQLKTSLKADNWIVLNVWSIALSPDGKTIVSGHHADSTVKIWDLTNQRLVHTLKGHGWAVNSVAVSPDGQIVASGGADSNIKLWNVSTGREIRNFNGVSDGPVGLVQSFFGNNVSDNQVCTVAFSPDGKTLASGGENQQIKLWGVNNKNVNFLKGSSEKVHTVAFSPDGKTLASGGADGIIRIWNLLTGKVTFNLGDSSCVYSLAFSPDGKTLVSGNGDNTIQVWTLN
ncbi:WD40 repeat domain-containing protein, partial [Nodularia sphaerocarpa CS-585A2]